MSPKVKMEIEPFNPESYIAKDSSQKEKGLGQKSDKNDLGLVFKKGFESNQSYSKFLQFKLNAKNSKGLVFSNVKKTVIPTFQCKYCFKIYLKSTSLGGHVHICR